jgi:hypothetical protein
MLREVWWVFFKKTSFDLDNEWWHPSLQNQKTEIKAKPWERGGRWDGIKIVLLWFVAEEYYCTFVGTSLHGPNNIAGENVTVILWNSYNKALSLRPKMCLQLQEQDTDFFVPTSKRGIFLSNWKMSPTCNWEAEDSLLSVPMAFFDLARFPLWEYRSPLDNNVCSLMVTTHPSAQRFLLDDWITCFVYLFPVNQNSQEV